MTIFSNLDMQLTILITILILLVSAAALLFWLISFPQYILCELFELTDKDTAGGVKISKRKRRVLLLKELPLFFCCQMPGVLWKKIRKRFSSGLICCYKVPHYSDLIGGKIPFWFYVGDTAQIALSFPWQKPCQNEGDECGSISSFIYCNEVSCPSLEIELEAEGMRIAGKQTQIYKLNSLPAVYRWDISADNAGVFILKITAKLYSRPDIQPIYAVAAQKVRVVQIPFLTGGQARIAAATSAALAAGCAGKLLFM